jgi:formate dehydrogenase iron-sulfur subunit
MPVSFFLSSIAAGLGLVMLIEVWISKAWKRPLQASQLASLGQITFWSLLVYLVFRLGDIAIRGQFGNIFSGGRGALFAAELILGIVPLVLLARSRRASRTALILGAAATTAGIVLNRVNIVLLAISLRGPMPWVAPEPYSPTIFEWGVSVGLIAATIFLFGLAARLMPVLPKSSRAQGG